MVAPLLSLCPFLQETKAPTCVPASSGRAHSAPLPAPQHFRKTTSQGAPDRREEPHQPAGAPAAARAP